MLAFGGVFDAITAVIGVIVLALVFSFTKAWFRVDSELDWVAALIFFFGLRIGNRLDLIERYQRELTERTKP